MIIILNIASKFVTIKLSKSIEAYLKYTFSRDLLVFAIAWMGTRDIYIAFFIVCMFILLIDVLFNEDCPYCILPESFVQYHIEKNKNDTTLLTDQDIENIKNIANKIEKIHGVGNEGNHFTDDKTPEHEERTTEDET